MNIHIDPRTAELTFWLLLCIAFSAVIGQEIDWGRQLHPRQIDIKYEPVNYSSPLVSLPLNLDSADRYLEMVERPLFIVTRRPAPPPPPPTPPSTMKKGQFKLSGVSIVGDKKMAFLVELSSGRTKVVREGEIINGMIVQKIEPGLVILVQGSDQEQLYLKIALSKGAGPQTPEPTLPGNAPAPATINTIISNTAPPPAQPQPGSGPDPSHDREALRRGMLENKLAPTPVGVPQKK